MASDDELLARIEASSKAGQDRDAALLARIEAMGKPAGPDPKRETARAENSTVGGMLSGTKRAIEGGYTFGLRDEAQAALNGAVSSGLTGVMNMAQGRAPAFGETYSQVYDESLGRERTQSKQFAEDHPVLSTAGGITGGALLGGAPARAIGQALAPAMTQINPLLAGALRVTAGGAVAGAATGFGEAEGGLGPRIAAAGEGAMVGAGVGAATHGAFGAANRMLNPIRPNLSPEAAALRTAAQAEGIPLSVGQETGSKLMQNVDSQLAQLPGSSGMAADAIEAQKRAFNAAVLRRAGEQADIASPEVLNDARQRIGGVINEVSKRNTLRVTPDLQARLAEVEDSLRFLPAEAAGPVRARIEQVRGMMVHPPEPPGGRPPPGAMIDPATTTPLETPLPTIPGASYRMLDSQIGRSMRGTTNGDLRAALGDIRQTLRTAMDDSISPEDATAWQRARREYANLMVAADAAKGAGGAAAEGHISPLALRGALDRSTGGGYVWGRGDLNELARVGQGVLRQPPDSGTAGRSLINGMLTGSAPVAGFAAGGLPGAMVGAAAPFVLPNLAQRFINSPAGRHWLINGLGQLDPAIANASAITAGSQTERNRLLQQD